MAKGGAALKILALIIIILLLYFAYEAGYLDRFVRPVENTVNGAVDGILNGEPWQHFEPEVNITAPIVQRNLSSIESLAFHGVNKERTENRLAALEWKSEVAFVARLYSQEMADRKFFSHRNPENKSHDDRLHRFGIYYYNISAENIAKINYVSYYTYDRQTGKTLNKTYRTLAEVAESAVEGWMNSTSHRENIMIPGFDKSGMGVAYDPGNETFYLTQLFITRIHCGYKGASCCRTEGYYPWCYSPWECEDRICA